MELELADSVWHQTRKHETCQYIIGYNFIFFFKKTQPREILINFPFISCYS